MTTNLFVYALFDPAVSRSHYVVTSFGRISELESSTFLAFAWETEESHEIPQSREPI